MAIDTIISNDELVVVGPPASISVSVDIGPTGERGSIFWTGYGLPSENVTALIDAKLNDLYINRQPGGNYGVVYKLTAEPGGSSWQSVLKFQPISYSIQKLVPFISGSGSISIPLSDIYNPIPLDIDANTILIQATAELNNPAFISISSKSIVDVGSTKTFIANLEGAELSSGTTSLLSSSAIPINLYITSGVSS